MAINSLIFLTFFIIVAAVYFLLPGKLQWMWLMLAGLYWFYKGSTPVQLAAFVLIVLVNYLVTLWFSGKEKPVRQRIFAALIVVDIAVFVLTTYVEPLHETLSRYAPGHMSYFMFILMGYVIDVYWDKVPVQKNPGKVLLFSGFFPQLISGPFVRYSQMESQLWGEKHKFSYERTMRGLERIIWGLFKKIVISERCGVIVAEVYNNYQVYSGFYIVIATVLYAMQLYTDFSGLMDIVIGASDILGITLPENFNTPFFARSMAEFWRRWHITLGLFLKDYVLMPIQRTAPYKKLSSFCKEHLGKDYRKKYNIPAWTALFISWTLIGAWHGVGFNYVFGVGIYMWAIIVLSEFLQPVFKKIIAILHIDTERDSYKLFQQIRTFFIYLGGVIFFRAPDFATGVAMWKRIFNQFNYWIFFDKSLYNLGLDRVEFGIMVFGLLLVLFVSYFSYSKDIVIWDYLSEQGFIFKILVFGALFVCILCWGYYGEGFNASDFIYGRF